jgi:hypothetical protein
MSMSVTDLILDPVIRSGFQVLGALVILGVGVLVARWIGTLTGHWLQGQKIEPPVRWLMVRTIRAVVLWFALVVALDKFGFQVAPLVAGIGAAGLGITFALQGALGNMMAGVECPAKSGSPAAPPSDQPNSSLFLLDTEIRTGHSSIIVEGRCMSADELQGLPGPRSLTIVRIIRQSLGPPWTSLRVICAVSPQCRTIRS